MERQGRESESRLEIVPKVVGLSANHLHEAERSLEMIAINTVIGVLACLVCLLAVTSFALLIKVQALHERCMAVMLCVLNWLEQQGQEAASHDGTD